MLEDNESFAIILANNAIDVVQVVSKMSERRQIGYNRCKLKDDEKYSYVLYAKPKDKQYIFDMCRNKKLKLIWKDYSDFYIIDFSNNTKGDIVTYLSNIDFSNGTIEGNIVTYNIKEEFRKCSKIPLVSDKILDDNQPYEFEHFIFYIKSKLEA